MSIQAGVWNFDGEPITRELIAELSDLSRAFGPDGEGVWREGPVAMLYRPFHTTRESWLENQPLRSRSGFVLTWDGRLDNREELIPRLANVLRGDFTDAAIVMAAFELWGVEAFERLVGDWALSVWDSCEQRLILARDFAGTRELYYSVFPNRVMWTTRLEALLLASGETFNLSEEYIARYFARFPLGLLTPYEGILSVPPGCWAEIKNGRATVSEFWKFDLTGTLKCSDAEYDEGFRESFFRSVRRRLRACDPVMSELSGGVDTGSIVSVADRLIASGLAETPGLETISYYVPDEPNWDEMPYVRVVEQARGVEGIHMDTSPSLDILPFSEDAIAASPGYTQAGFEAAATFSGIMESRGCRTLLSGVGGDELTAGVPSPVHELLELLAHGRFIRASRQLRAWSVALKTPMLHIAAETLGALVPNANHVRAGQGSPVWLSPKISELTRSLTGEENRRYHLRVKEPGKRIVLRTVAHLAGQQGASPGIGGFCWEKRFPMLDRDFVQFILSVPRSQMQRPGRRRALLRRAMTGIVPVEILERKRKAFLAVRPQRTMAESPFYGESPMLVGLGYVEGAAYRETARQAHNGVSAARVGMRQAMLLEAWLESELPSRVLKHAGAGIESYKLCRSPRQILRKEVSQS